MTDNNDQLNSSQFLNIILENIADGVFAIDSDWNIILFNKAAERITGFEQNEALGKKCYDVFQTNICQKDCALEQSINTGKPLIDVAINILNRSGRTIPVSISTAVLKSEEGKVIGGVESFRDLSKIEELKKQLLQKYTFEDIISQNPVMLKYFSILPDISESDSTVLITGPSGSGKELFARAIHNLSDRKDQPYVVINCSALPETLIESELFGYVKGAFTDAKKDKPGSIAQAEMGTLFIDEIGDISPAVQVKLLRFLQEKKYQPLGYTEELDADVRIVLATNRDLTELVSENKFREDLYYRINTVLIDLPPLSERKEDIPLLIDHFIKRFNTSKDKNIKSVSEEVMKVLMNYDYPGNVRELEHIIEYAFILCKKGFIQIEHLPENLKSKSIPSTNAKQSVMQPHKLAEKELILNLLRELDWNKTKVAERMGINRSTLWRKMKKFGIE